MNNTSCQITQDWVNDLTTNFDDHVSIFIFRIMGHSHLTYQPNPYTFSKHRWPKMELRRSRLKWTAKKLCPQYVKCLLGSNFPSHGFMNALGIVWLHYSLVIQWASILPIHLAVLKAQSCSSKKVAGFDDWAECSLDERSLTYKKPSSS